MNRRVRHLIEALRIRGPFRGSSGYDHHTRQLVRAIAGLGVAVELADVPEWGSLRLSSLALDPWFDRLQDPVDAGMTLHFTMPHQVTCDSTEINVNYTMFEADRVPSTWINLHRQHQMVVVPTASSRQAWLASGLPAEKIQVCPLGVSPDAFHPEVEPLAFRSLSTRDVAGYGSRFLNVSELRPRKNLIGLLQAWMMATRDDDDAVLIIKLGRASPAKLEQLRAGVRELEAKLGRCLEDVAPVEIMFGYVPDGLMPSLYTSATHYISMSHGEGWDNAMIEAAATGLQLIAPDHSAYTAYLDASMARLIPSVTVPARIPDDPALQELFHRAMWWQPDIETAAGLIREAIDGLGPVTRSARDAVAGRFRWEQSAEVLLSILSEVEAADGERHRQ
jgi:glycosyltransferase involved in cell wall biosynthesis